MEAGRREGRALRILECLTYYLPHRTGLTLHVQRLVEGLAAMGHDVTVLSARFHASLAGDERAGGVRVVRLRAPLRISRGMVMPAYPFAALAMVRRNDVVHVHSPMLETPLLALLCRLAGTPLVITHHGDLVLPTGVLNRLIERTVLASFHSAAASAARLVAYSTDYAGHSRYLRRHLSKVVAIMPPVAAMRPDPQRVAALRARLGLEDRRVVGYAGRFVEEKRPDLLLAALPEVRARVPGAALLFAGQHVLPYERFDERCRSLIDGQREHVRFLGLLADDAELAAFYAACDVLVLPSQSECFGLVQPEAMLCGTPVVATDIPGARVPVRATGMGVLAAPGDPQALARAILRVLERPEAFVRPRDEVARMFSLEETLASYEAVLLEAAG